MCGILGEFGKSILDRTEFYKLNNLSKKRGPDMDGYWTDNSVCQLGFNRLSILDLSDKGNQPMVSQNGEWVMIMNGEVYNFPEIRKMLGKSKTDFISQTDTEVVLAAFEAWGIEKTLEIINGIFAIALYERDNNQIHLIRDFAGVKPLYFGIMNNCLVFASQYDQIFYHPIFKNNLIPNKESLTDFVRMGYIPAPNAFFNNTFQVRPGEIVTINQKMDINKKNYYSFPEPTSEYKETNFEAVEKLDYILSEVVRSQLVSDVSVGAFLSGGIDSPLICNYINKQSPQLETFTIGTVDLEYDETTAALGYADFLNVKNHLYTYTDRDLVRDINDHFKAYSEPFGNYSSLPSFQVCKNAKSKFTVVLGGDGGDEIFWGYPRFNWFTSHRYWFNINKTLRILFSSIIRKLGASVSYGIYANSIQEWVLGHHSQINYEILEKILPENKNSNDLLNLYDCTIELKDRKEILHWLRENEFYGHLQRVLLKIDRASMYHGLEVRVPFVDKKILEFSAIIEPELASRHQEPKYMLKQLMKKKYPLDIIQMNKKGFSFNLGNSLKTILKDEVKDLLLGRDPYPHNTFNRKELNNEPLQKFSIVSDPNKKSESPQKAAKNYSPTTKRELPQKAAKNYGPVTIRYDKGAHHLF